MVNISVLDALNKLKISEKSLMLSIDYDDALKDEFLIELLDMMYIKYRPNQRSYSTDEELRLFLVKNKLFSRKSSYCYASINEVNRTFSHFPIERIEADMYIAENNVRPCIVINVENGLRIKVLSICIRLSSGGI